ncbi:hypothetical protein C8E87_5094 [Paractinoplanes brasiliensis]|uniref:Uncharacterized protein n=1 Tax=Paractinoplanes brasiliensis TaxID=52695 RepID=A0A4R6JZL2_9ACTN|nr:hypothetical protein C8E87_5094 [Actinoplanes brasiliensis]GID27355.1 hypothetical protein Abr02nite_23380 [Actinoplanes brasiliensis]
MTARLWRWLPWVRRSAKRRQADALVAAREWQEAEREAARRRVIEQAERGRQDRP